MAHSDSGFSQPAAGITGSTRLRSVLRTLLPATLLAFPLTASALFNDRVEVFAAENVTWDSNIFRLDDRTGQVQSDRTSTTSLGVTANVPYSLQRFQFAYTWFATRYQKNSQLDFDGHTVRAAWLWSITPRFTGDVGYGESETLASFSQFIGSRTRDVVKTRQGYGNAVWFATPSWRVHGAAGISDQEHTDPARKIFDIETATGETGLTYVTAQDNRIGVAVRAERGKPKQPPNLLAGGVDNAYHQRGLGVVGHWAVTGHSTVDGRLEYTKRDFDNDSRRNYSGPTVRLTHTWTPTGKIEVLTTLRREISPIEEVQSSNFVLVKGVSVKPRWNLTDKVTLTGSAEYATWDYRADLISTTAYQHRIRSAGVSAIYRATPRVLLQGGWLRERRTSSLAVADYDVDLFSIEGRISF
jgi:exopolysaccharide biosynthesis operon protein EpsL